MCEWVDYKILKCWISLLVNRENPVMYNYLYTPILFFYVFVLDGLFVLPTNDVIVTAYILPECKLSLPSGHKITLTFDLSYV